MMKEGTLDVVLNTVKTPEREKYLLFTPAYADNPNIIISKKDKLYPDVESLIGKKAALPKGFATQGFMEENYPQIELLLEKNILESMKAVSFGKADAAFVELAVFNYLLAEHMMTNLTVSGETKMDDPEYSLLNIATRIDLPLLQSILIKGLASISIKENRELQQKWLEIEDEKISKLILTKKEQEYLEEKPLLNICVDPNWLPFEKINEQGTYIGIGSDVLEIVSKKINKPINLVKTKSWSETIENFLNKKCDILPMVVEIAERKKIMNFTKPYIKKSLVVATKDDQFFIQDSSELLGEKIGLVHGYAFSELIKEKYPTMNIVPVKNIKEGLKKVQEGELFGFVDALPSTGYVIQKEGMIDLKIAGRLEFDVELSIASQKDEVLLNTILQKVLDDIPNEQIDSIVGKWISIKVEQSFDYKILIYTIMVFLIIFALLMYRQYYINKMNKELEKISITDAITNIYNRRHFNELFPKIINSAKRYNDLVSFLVMDIDHFKQYNDIYGHQKGDDALIKVAGAIKDSLHRTDDLCFRLGGEEFGVIFKGESPDKALEFANRIKQNIEDLHIQHRGNSASSYITVSMGLICINARDISSDDKAYKEADDLLYEAKDNGRNRVETIVQK